MSDGKQRILFVDDEVFISQAYFEELQKQFDVDWASTAHEAVEAILTHEDYAAVVIDIMMPCPEGVDLAIVEDGMTTGLWVVEQVQERLRERRLPVLLLSHRDVDGYRAHVERILQSNSTLYDLRHKPNTRPFIVPLLVQRLINQNTQRR